MLKNKILESFDIFPKKKRFLDIYYQYLIMNCFMINILDKSYHLLPLINMIPMIKASPSLEYLYDILEKPVDIQVYQAQKEIMLNVISILEPKIIGYIKNLK